MPDINPVLVSFGPDGTLGSLSLYRIVLGVLPEDTPRDRRR